MNTSAALTTLANINLSPKVSFLLKKGSVLNFVPKSPEKAAIVNAANNKCLGGGGVDGQISDAGGPNLLADRRALPKVNGVRCPTGSAVLTGPNVYDQLHVRNVIHAVGPDYSDFDRLADGHELLRSAYKSALTVAAKNDLVLHFACCRLGSTEETAH